MWPWTKDLWGSDPPEIVGERDDYNIEKILNLKPDLILAQYSGMTKEQYDELSKIAPTVGQPKDFDGLRRAVAGHDAAGRQGAGQGRRGRQADRRASTTGSPTVREEHPDWKGKTVAVVDPYEPGQYAVFQKTDPKAVFMTEMGFEVPDEINEAAGDNNAAEVSAERADMIDTDLLLFLTADPSAEARIEGRPGVPGPRGGARRTGRCSCPTPNRRSAPRCRSTPC